VAQELASFAGGFSQMASTSNVDLRRTILDTARQLLVEDGYKNLSMRKIAGKIGCSPGTIYLYFKNKDAIFYALIDEGIERLYLTFEALPATEVDPLKHLEDLCRNYIEFGLNNPEYYEIMYMSHPMIAERYPQEQYRKQRLQSGIPRSNIVNNAASSI
jgi:AcrR family transcriptional regulator